MTRWWCMQPIFNFTLSNLATVTETCDMCYRNKLWIVQYINYHISPSLLSLLDWVTIYSSTE